jgi:hypothetical protein
MVVLAGTNTGARCPRPFSLLKLPEQLLGLEVKSSVIIKKTILKI